MAQIDVFSFAAAVAALLLAGGFIIAYLANRRLASFRWWAAAFVLLGLALATATLRLDGNSAGIKALSWGLFLAAAASIALGLFRHGATRANPVAAIAVASLPYAGIAASLLLTSAPPHSWFLLGPLPTLGLMAWALVLLLNARAWFHAAALGAGMAVIATRALWFANDLANTGPIRRPLLRGPLAPDGQNPPNLRLGLDRAAQTALDFRPPPGLRPPVEQPLTIALLTIAALLGLAAALVLRDLLASVRDMRERSTTDGLTGLLNRATFDEQARTLLDQTASEPVSLVLFDIDHFKRINDTCGHPMGDRVIARLGRILGELTILRTISGRIGGEEFAVLLPGSDPSTARLLAETVRTGLAGSDFGAALDWTVTLSAGIASRLPGETLEALVARADTALYAAKTEGRDRVKLAGEAPVRRRRFA